MSHLPMFVRIACAGILAVACAIVSAQTYRWIDPATGRTMYSDMPPTGKVRDLVRIGAPGLEKADQQGADSSGMSFATRQASQKYPVTLYTGADCEPCAQARELLMKRNVPFVEKSMQNDADMKELKNMVGDTSVPTLKVGSQKLRGFEPFSYNNVLDLAGYPKAPSTTSTVTPESAAGGVSTPQ